MDPAGLNQPSSRKRKWEKEEQTKSSGEDTNGLPGPSFLLPKASMEVFPAPTTTTKDEPATMSQTAFFPQQDSLMHRMRSWYCEKLPQEHPIPKQDEDSTKEPEQDLAASLLLPTRDVSVAVLPSQMEKIQRWDGLSEEERTALLAQLDPKTEIALLLDPSTLPSFQQSIIEHLATGHGGDFMLDELWGLPIARQRQIVAQMPDKEKARYYHKISHLLDGEEALQVLRLASYRTCVENWKKLDLDLKLKVLNYGSGTGTVWDGLPDHLDYNNDNDSGSGRGSGNGDGSGGEGSSGYTLAELWEDLSVEEKGELWPKMDVGVQNELKWYLPSWKLFSGRFD
jgi:hypothetical protein